jgi:antitoxin (DNA-binding transcriptional repressor) of toxin-antitoxin stability system
MASTQVNLYEAKTQLSSLVERAAKGEEIIIAKAGKPVARLSALTAPELAVQPESPKVYREFGDNVLGITFLADDWEDDIPLEYFEDEAGDKLFSDLPETVESK